MGKSKIVIENGKLNVKNLKKLRLTVDGLEMRMRNMGPTKLSDIKIGTIEPNGQLGYELKEDAKPLTIGEFKKLINQISQQNLTTANKDSSQDIFEEIHQNIPQEHPEILN
ncbi:YetF domain-containing protein [Bacillus sp. AFS037270]|uniref:YetF domain-containing protein n=2 Tax=unclassified Bacillus (in: firmicutes) TaxID=185979 RepID=UPI00268D3B7B